MTSSLFEKEKNCFCIFLQDLGQLDIAGQPVLGVYIKKTCVDLNTERVRLDI